MKRYTGLILGVFAILVNYLFNTFPNLTEAVYYRFFFQILRVIYDHTLGLLPIPMVYFLFALIVWWIAQRLKDVGDAFKKKDGLFKGIGRFLLRTVNSLGWVLFMFYTLWGYNYAKIPFEERMDLPTVKADTTQLYREVQSITSELIDLRRTFLTDTAHYTQSEVPNSLESDLRDIQEVMFNEWGEPSLGRVRIRTLRPSGILLRISTAGVYIPFVLEGHVDGGLHPLQVSFTMAHEMAHGYGYTDEGVCNFLGYLTCMKSKDPQVRYSGLLGYWRYLMSDMRKSMPQTYKQYWKEVPRPIRVDINDISIQMDKFPDIMPAARDIVYDNYLKSHGVKGGISNYNDIVRLVAQWEAKLKRK